MPTEQENLDKKHKIQRAILRYLQEHGPTEGLYSDHNSTGKADEASGYCGCHTASW